MELFDHGLAVGADLIGYVVEVHGIKGVKVGLEAGVLMVFLGQFLCFVVSAVPRAGRMASGVTGEPALRLWKAGAAAGYGGAGGADGGAGT